MTWPRKLSDEQYKQILAAFVGAETSRSIARRFGIHDSTVYLIARKAGIPLKGHRNKRQQIIKLSMDRPELGPTAIAKLLGANAKYINRVRTECGLTKRKHVALTGAPTPDQSGLQASM